MKEIMHVQRIENLCELEDLIKQICNTQELLSVLIKKLEQFEIRLQNRQISMAAEAQ